ncbi:MAG: DegT/DnrJ/EryC1/StrS family aminotransferase [Verrucomicrobiota bacterium]
MWARKRIDIGWRHLARGVWRCLAPGQVEHHLSAVDSCLRKPNEALVCLSVRSGFDLWLAARQFPKGSEILLTALTLPDMATIVRTHGLTPVPVDLELSTMGPDLADLRSKVSEKTRAVVVAHLFGIQLDLDPVADLCQEHDILLVEDCAQSFHSPNSWGHPRSDFAMFSFGVIKTMTVGGGGIVQVRDSQIRAQMDALQAQYPKQIRSEYSKKLLKLAGFKLLCSRLGFALLNRFLQLRGGDLDEFIAKIARGFPDEELLDQIRRQPCISMIALLAHRLQTFDQKSIEARKSHGEQLQQLLDATPLDVPGDSAEIHTFWVFPVLADDPGALIQLLRSNGFDATSQQSLRVIEPAEDSVPAAKRAREALAKMVYLPAYPEIPISEIQRMAQVISDLTRDS